MTKARRAKPVLKQKPQKKLDLSKYLQKGKKGQRTKRQNTYVFEGFYEKLKKMDMRLAHQADSQFDQLMTAEENEDDLKSNFIVMLRTLRAENQTLDLKNVMRDLEPLCYSYPLLVVN